MKINLIHMLWSASRQLIVFKSHDKYNSSTKTVLTNIKIYFMWTSSTTIICHLVCCECLKETSRTGSKKCSHVHCSILDNRFSELKKNLDSKFSKSSLKNFKIWLSSLKETFLNAQNTNDMHSDNSIFLPFERGWFFRNGRMDSFLKGKIFLFWK